MATLRSQSKHSHRHATSIILDHVGDLDQLHEVDDNCYFANLISKVVLTTTSFESDAQRLYFHTWSNAHESAFTIGLRLRSHEERAEREA